MITVANYFDKKDSIDWSKVPQQVKDLRAETEADWDLYDDATDVRKSIDLFVAAINKSQTSTPTENLKKAVEKDFGKSDKIVFVAPQKEKVDNFNLIAYAKFKGDKKFGAMDMSEGRQVGNLMYASLIPIASKQKAINILNKSKEAGEIVEFELRIGGTNKVEYSSLKSNEKFDLIATYAGGVTVISNKNKKTSSDYETIAHVFSDGKIKYFRENLPKEVIKFCETHIASVNIDHSSKTPSKNQSKDIYLVKDGKVLTNHGMKDWWFTDNPEFAHTIEDIDFANRMKKHYDAEIIMGFDLMKSEVENYKKPSTKAKAPAKAKAIKPIIEKTFVDNYSTEFQLIRRFWNMIEDENITVEFRKVRLLYMAFNKAAIERKVRKTNENADLFTECNKKIINLFTKFDNPEQKPYEINFTDKKLYEEIKEYVTDVAVNPAVAVLKRFVALQNTRPEISKVNILKKAIVKVLENDKNNRLASELSKANKELEDYIKNPKESIEVTIHGLSRPATQKVCHNRVKCTGLTKDGRLRPGYKFRENTNEVIKVGRTTVKKKNLINNKKRVVGLGCSDYNDDDIEHIYVHDPVILVNNNFDYSTLNPTGNNNPAPTPIEPIEQLAAPAIEVEKPLVKNKLMQMQFDSLQMDQGWENFMQDPAKNMRLAIWGKPKNGKTAGSLQMANYLTKFGNVLYNFVDQGFNKSTQDLWLSSGLANNNKAVPTDVQTLDELEKEIKTGKYTFVFIDMISDYINREGIKPYEFKERFIKKYPKVSFILIFEVTKSGDFKGDQGWTHIVDAIVTVEDFCMENRGRYGMGHHIIWEEGLKKFNPKKYAEIQENEIVDVEHI